MKFVDLEKQYLAYKEEIDHAVQEVLSSCQFINGPAVSRLEEELSAYCGARHCIACSSGTDALLAALMALDLRPGDEVICPAFSFIATASMVSLLRGVPVFVDIDPVTFNIDPERIREKITDRTRGIIAVSLYGQCADFDTLNALAEENGLWIIEDGAQSFGALYKGRRSCNLTKVSTTSFFPAKPLGCYGDGGAVFSNDNRLGADIRRIINHGQEARYRHSRIGINGRMDTLQAAILIVKLSHFDAELVNRQRVADRYTAILSGHIGTPTVLSDRTSVWAQYTVRHRNRDEIIGGLEKKGIPAAVHYPMPLDRQPAFGPRGETGATCPVSSRLSGEVFSLPMHPFLSEQEICHIGKEILALV